MGLDMDKAVFLAAKMYRLKNVRKSPLESSPFKRSIYPHRSSTRNPLCNASLEHSQNSLEKDVSSFAPSPRYEIAMTVLAKKRLKLPNEDGHAFGYQMCRT